MNVADRTFSFRTADNSLKPGSKVTLLSDGSVRAVGANEFTIGTIDGVENDWAAVTLIDVPAMFTTTDATSAGALLATCIPGESVMRATPRPGYEKWDASRKPEFVALRAASAFSKVLCLPYAAAPAAAPAPTSAKKTASPSSSARSSTTSTSTTGGSSMSTNVITTGLPTSGAAAAEFNSLVEKHMAAGKSKSEAVRAAIHENPALHSKALADWNPHLRRANEQAPGAASTADPIARFDAAVSAEMQKSGSDRRKATANVVRRDPQLHQDYLAAANLQVQAKKEWSSNFEACRSKFSSEQAYVGYRVAELRGRVR